MKKEMRRSKKMNDSSTVSPFPSPLPTSMSQHLSSQPLRIEFWGRFLRKMSEDRTIEKIYCEMLRSFENLNSWRTGHGRRCSKLFLHYTFVWTPPQNAWIPHKHSSKCLRYLAPWAWNKYSLLLVRTSLVNSNLSFFMSLYHFLIVYNL